MTEPTGPDLRFCGICWRGTDKVRLHYCDEPLGHQTAHKCHCGVTLERQPLKPAPGKMRDRGKAITK